eukprot:764294-Hanusia_phi.AAC.1
MFSHLTQQSECSAAQPAAARCQTRRCHSVAARYRRAPAAGPAGRPAVRSRHGTATVPATVLIVAQGAWLAAPAGPTVTGAAARAAGTVVVRSPGPGDQAEYRTAGDRRLIVAQGARLAAPRPDGHGCRRPAPPELGNYG